MWEEKVLFQYLITTNYLRRRANEREGKIIVPYMVEQGFIEFIVFCKKKKKKNSNLLCTKQADYIITIS